MNRWVLIFMLVCVSGWTAAQSVMISASGNTLHRLNVADCTTDFVTYLDLGAYDIAFHPNGNLYGIRTTGIVFEIDTITGDCDELIDLNSDGMNALIIDINGLMYMTSDEGELYTYDVDTDTETYLGNVGYASAGDLTFYNGDLYMAAVGDDIVFIDLDNPSQSYIEINENVPGSIFGILSYSECGETSTYAVTYEPTQLYLVDFESGSLNLQCDIGISAWGGASEYEFLGSSPLVVDEIDVEHATCSLEEGSVELVAVGGLGDISYSIDGTNFYPDGSFSNLSIGLHTVTIIDDNGCLVTEEIEVEPGSAIQIINVQANNLACNAEGSTVLVDAVGQDMTLQYSLDGIDFQNENLFEEVANGVYTITVTDGDECTTTEEISIDNAVPVIMETVVQAAVCTGSMGSIEVDIQGGVGDINYSIDGEDWQSTPVFENINPGDYEVTIIDENNCQDSEMVTIDQYLDPQISDIVNNPESCNLSNGNSTIVSTGGTGDIAYALEGGTFQSSNFFDGLEAGNYAIQIMDEFGCTDESIVEVLEINVPQVTELLPTPTLCGEFNGQVLVVANGGVGNLQYSLNFIDFQSTGNFENLEPGFYSCTIIDDSGCEIEADFEIEITPFPEIMGVDIESATCNLDNGSFITNVASGVGEISYFVNDVAYGNVNQYQDLAPGNYAIDIMDSNGCVDEAIAEIVASTPPSITGISVQPTTCNLDNGNAQVIVEGGNAVQYTVDGINYQMTPNFSELSDGEYLLTIEDADGCTDLIDFQIADSQGPAFGQNSTAATSCGGANGLLLVDGSSSNGQITYSVDGINYQSDSIFDNMIGGLYDVYIKDEAGCVLTQSITVGLSSKPEILGLYIQPKICEVTMGSASIEVEGGNGQLMFTLDQYEPQAHAFYNGLDEGVHTISIEDELGCMTDSVFIVENLDCSFYIPNAFSPDGDGLNELFKVSVPEDFAGNVESFRISDRWGEIIYEKENVHPKEIKWDGSYVNNYNYQNLYSYHAVVEFYTGIKQEYRGTITLLR